MYTLRDAEEREHGPLSAGEVRQWIADGRVNATTLARAVGEAKWRPLANFIEFSPALQSAFLSESAPQQPRPRTFRLLAIASLVLSITGICFLPGAILGAVTLFLAKKWPTQFGGRRLAIAAIIIGILWPLSVGTTAYYKMRSMRAGYFRGENCFMHVRSLTTSLQVVAIANGGTFPPADQWCDAIRKEVTSTNHYQCPEDPHHAACSYAYNENVAGIKNPDPSTVVVFEADLGWNGSGTASNVVARPRHGQHVFVGLANGSVQLVHTNQIRQLRWKP